MWHSVVFDEFNISIILPVWHNIVHASVYCITPCIVTAVVVVQNLQFLCSNINVDPVDFTMDVFLHCCPDLHKLPSYWLGNLGSLGSKDIQPVLSLFLPALVLCFSFCLMLLLAFLPLPITLIRALYKVVVCPLQDLFPLCFLAVAIVLWLLSS